MKFIQHRFIITLFTCLFLLVLLNACQGVPPSIDSDHAASVDRLLRLMNQRLDVAPMVAKVKWNSGGAIDDPAREKWILDAITTQASDLDVIFTRRFFQAQFDASKSLQQALHQQWRDNVQPKFDHVPDLSRDIRPLLDQLTLQIIAVLREVWPLLHDSNVQAYISSRSGALIRGDVDGLPRSIAMQALQRK